MSEIEAKHDKTDTQQLSSTIVMMARAKPVEYTPPKSLSEEKVHIAGVDSDLSTRDHLQNYLGTRGISASSSTLEDLASREWAGEWLILVDETEGSFLASLQPEQLTALKTWLTKPIKCIWVTRKVYLDPQNTTGGLVTGFARTLRGENSQCQLYTLDLSSDGDITAHVIYHVLERAHYSHDDPISRLDYEIAEKDGQLWTCRLVNDTPLENAYGPARKMDASSTQVAKAPHHLIMGEVGILESLTMAQDDAYTAIPDGHVLVDVKAVGLDDRVSTSPLFDISQSNSASGWIHCPRVSSSYIIRPRMFRCRYKMWRECLIIQPWRSHCSYRPRHFRNAVLGTFRLLY